MAEIPITYALLTLGIALLCGLWPVYSKIKDDANKLKILTGIAAGIIIASALLVVIPEGYELASVDEHDTHEDESKIAGSIALVMLEVENGDINASQAIEEIETLVGGHDAHADADGHDAHDDDQGDEEESLSESVLHVIEEVEDGDVARGHSQQEISDHQVPRRLRPRRGR